MFVGGKQNKKDKKFRDRKMSLPSEMSIKTFQNQKSLVCKTVNAECVHGSV